MHSTATVLTPDHKLAPLDHAQVRIPVAGQFTTVSATAIIPFAIGYDLVHVSQDLGYQGHTAVEISTTTAPVTTFATVAATIHKANLVQTLCRHDFHAYVRMYVGNTRRFDNSNRHPLPRKPPQNAEAISVQTTQPW